MNLEIKLKNKTIEFCVTEFEGFHIMDISGPQTAVSVYKCGDLYNAIGPITEEGCQTDDTAFESLSELLEFVAQETWAEDGIGYVSIYLDKLHPSIKEVQKELEKFKKWEDEM